MSGHGWVKPNPDGSKARCGGPAICPTCRSEAGPLLLSGVGRDEQAPRSAALTFYFSRRPTDDEMRAIHEGMRDLVNGG